MAARKTKTTKPIVDWDIDEASYRGDGNEGVYWQTGKGPDGWYVTAVVYCEHFVATIYKDDGPYKNQSDANRAGLNAAIVWCTDSGMAADSLINSPRVMLRVLHKGHICFAEKEHGQTLRRLRSQHPLLRSNSRWHVTVL